MVKRMKEKYEKYYFLDKDCEQDDVIDDIDNEQIIIQELSGQNNEM